MILADVSIRRPVFATMLMVAMVLFGLLAYPRIGVDLYPDVDYPVITATVVYPGADPETMETKVAEKIEEAVQGIGGIDSLNSTNLESVTQVVVQFELDVDAEQALAEVRQKIETIEGDLPSGADPPIVQKFDIGAAPVVSVAVSGDLPPSELSALVEDRVEARIEQIQGVGGIDRIGAREREIKLHVDPRKLELHGVTVDDIRQTLASQSIDMPAGYSTQGSTELSVKVRGEARTLDDLRNLVVPGARGELALSTVATVEDGLETARSTASLDGQSAIALVVRKQAGANTVAVAEEIREVVEELRPELEAMGAKISIPTDNSVFIAHAIDDLQFDLLLGAGLTVLIIFVFLGDGRATFISAMALPTSVLGTFLVMQVMGFTFNNLTMLALSLSVGILIDDAIVVIENIYRHLEMGKSGAQAAKDATSEIGLAVLATTLALVAVFVPVAIMDGLVGRFFFQFGITVAAAVLLSMFVSFTLTPLLSSRMLRGHGDAKKGLLMRAVDGVLDGITSAYSAVLGWALRHRSVTMMVALGTFVGAVGLLGQLKSEFIPREDRGQFAINIEMPAGTSLDATHTYSEAIATDVRDNLPNLVTAFSTVGDPQGSKVNEARIEVVLNSSKQRAFSQQDAMDWVRARYAGATGAELTVEEIAAVGGGGSQAPIQFVLQGPDLEALESTAAAMVERLQAVDGFVDVKSTAADPRPQLAIVVDRARAADLGVPAASIAQTIRALMAEDVVGELRGDDGSTDVVLAMPVSLRSNIDRLPNIQVRSASGTLVPLSAVTRIERGKSASSIARLDRQRQVTVEANLSGLALGDAQGVVQDTADALLPDGVTTKFIGNVEIMEESFLNMVIALGLAVALVYMILASQFDSFTQPIVIMVSLPLSFLGAFGALYLFDMSMNIFSMIGIIMLMGLVTKNAILLVDFANAERTERGKGTVEALISAGRIRLRPILMTTAATVFGMLPVALALSEGGETRAPMAMAVIGGIVTSTLLTLVVVPVVYALFDQAANSAWLSSLLGRDRRTSVATSQENDS